MKDDAEDYPVASLLYVCLASVAISLLAVVERLAEVFGASVTGIDRMLEPHPQTAETKACRCGALRVDVFTHSELYTGVLSEGPCFFKPDGSLSGVLLGEPKRFGGTRLAKDHDANSVEDMSEYWQPIAGGGHLYIPVEEISNINVRYVKPARNDYGAYTEGKAK